MIYDLHCVTEDGRQFIVEMQNGDQKFYVNRSIYYVSRAICDQAKTSPEKWKYDLMPVYIVSLMNFQHPDLEEEVISDNMLCNVKTGKRLSDKLRFIYIQLSLFNKKESELKSKIDEWIYLLKEMPTMDTVPAFAKKDIVFNKFLDQASYARLSVDEQRDYDRRLKHFRDTTNIIDYAEERGIAKGEAKANMENALKMKSLGIAEDIIFQVTGCRL